VVVDAPEDVGMAEKVVRTTLKKRSSILLGVELVERGEADAFFSAGNTAACWTIAKMKLGTLPEIDRPALTAVVPNIRGKTVLLDVGANSTCKTRHLEEFAVMGSLYAEEVLMIANPRVGLMSMGEEESKGTDLTREVHAALKESHLNFIGNVEGHEVFNGEADVVVMDGFTGNVILKSSETLASSIVFMLKEEIQRRPLAKLGALLASGAFKALKRRIDPREVGGAPLLGIKGCCVIGHGKSDEMAICEAVRMAGEFSRSGINSKINAEVARLSRLNEGTEAAR
jgi:glycerol-3-phosphate acyltransferase PlsX